MKSKLTICLLAIPALILVMGTITESIQAGARNDLPQVETPAKTQGAAVSKPSLKSSDNSPKDAKKSCGTGCS